MGLKSEKLLDRIGRHILEVLKEDARISHSRLGRIVGLSAPAAAERVKKLEEAGMIRGYHARIKLPEEAGRVTAFIELETPAPQYNRVRRIAARHSGILACHHISGQAAFMIKASTGSVEELEALLAEFSPLGQTRTSIVLSSFKEEKC